MAKNLIRAVEQGDDAGLVTLLAEVCTISSHPLRLFFQYYFLYNFFPSFPQTCVYSLFEILQQTIEGVGELAQALPRKHHDALWPALHRVLGENDSKFPPT